MIHNISWEQFKQFTLNFKYVDIIMFSIPGETTTNYLTRMLEGIGKGGILENRLIEEERKEIDIRMKIYSYVLASLLDYSEEGWQEAIGEYEDYLRGYTNYD